MPFSTVISLRPPDKAYFRRRVHEQFDPLYMAKGSPVQNLQNSVLAVVDVFSAFCAHVLTYGARKRKERKQNKKPYFQKMHRKRPVLEGKLGFVRRPRGFFCAKNRPDWPKSGIFPAACDDVFALKIAPIGPNQVDSQLLVGIFRPGATARPPPAGTVPEPIEALMP